MRRDRAERLLNRIHARHNPPPRKPGFSDFLADELTRLPAEPNNIDAWVAYERASLRHNDFLEGNHGPSDVPDPD